MMLDTPGQLPSQAEEIYQGFLRRPLATREMLRVMVEQYLRIVCSMMTEHESHSRSIANLLGSGLLDLLDTCPHHHLPHVQAAVLYFASSEDAVPDIESDEGFDDDARVFNAVCRLVERADLEISL